MLQRHITETITAALRDTPVVCLVGPRQAGKSTLAQTLVPPELIAHAGTVQPWLHVAKPPPVMQLWQAMSNVHFWRHAVSLHSQAFVHWMTPDMPVTGSQRPLQHCVAAVQSVPAPWQTPPGPTPPPAPVTPEPPVPNVPPRPAPPSLPIPGAAGLPLHDASKVNASRQIE